MILCWRRPQQALEAAMKELSKTSQLSAFPKKKHETIFESRKFLKKNILKCWIHLPPSNKLHPYKPFICSTSSWRPVINHPKKKRFPRSWWRGSQTNRIGEAIFRKKWSSMGWGHDMVGLPSLCWNVMVLSEIYCNFFTKKINTKNCDTERWYKLQFSSSDRKVQTPLEEIKMKKWIRRRQNTS